MQLSGKRYDTGEAITVNIEGDRISHIEHRGKGANATDSVPWIAPGFVDLQLNGYGGQQFSDADLSVERVASILETYLSFGTTRVCPTVTTQSAKVLEHAIRTIAEATEGNESLKRLVAGIHVEGPYISPEDGPRGAHPKPFTRPPKWDEFQRWQDAANGAICIVTLSPEYDEAPGFIDRAAKQGILVAIGHTAANSDQIRAAVDAGARLSTHLGNGSHLELRRHPNYIWDQLAEDRLTASVIADGHHLPAEVVKVIVRAKTPERVVLVSDLSGFAGLEPGIYSSNSGAVQMLDDERLVVAGEHRLLAGASRPIGTCIAQVMQMAELNLGTAIDMATRKPTQLLGLSPGELQVGDPADLVLFDLEEKPDQIQDLKVRATILSGECVYGHAPTVV